MATPIPGSVVRTSPYSFRGLGLEGLRLLALARAETGLPVVPV
jgi:3-deoxy-7-phosphoheptulonate synthase